MEPHEDENLSWRPVRTAPGQRPSLQSSSSFGKPSLNKLAMFPRGPQRHDKSFTNSAPKICATQCAFVPQKAAALPVRSANGVPRPSRGLADGNCDPPAGASPEEVDGLASGDTFAGLTVLHETPDPDMECDFFP